MDFSSLFSPAHLVAASNPNTTVQEIRALYGGGDSYRSYQANQQEQEERQVGKSPGLGEGGQQRKEDGGGFFSGSFFSRSSSPDDKRNASSLQGDDPYSSYDSGRRRSDFDEDEDE